MSVYFCNPGLIDLAAVRTLGVSVKDNDSAIGYFGTGLKFAIATILRHGGEIKLYRGDEVHTIGSEKVCIRGEDFEVVTLDGEQLGFTTQLGRDWQPWMAYRELASNALDEGGSYGLFDGSSCRALETMFVVSGGGIQEANAEAASILLQTEPIYKNEDIELHPGDGRQIFYRGVRVGDLPDPSVYRINLLGKIALTEDRTYSNIWEVYSRMVRGIAKISDEKILQRILTAGKNFLEHGRSFPAEYCSDAFKTVAGNLRSTVSDMTTANPSAIKIAEELALCNLGPSESISLSTVEQGQFERAISILYRAGYDIRKYEIVIVETLGPGVYGLAKEEKIFISRQAFQKGTHEIASTLLEEFAHLSTGFNDFDRSLQSWLFDELLRQVEHRFNEAF
jgi:hypothetical protein